MNLIKLKLAIMWHKLNKAGIVEALAKIVATIAFIGLMATAIFFITHLFKCPVL